MRFAIALAVATTVLMYVCAYYLAAWGIHGALSGG